MQRAGAGADEAHFAEQLIGMARLVELDTIQPFEASDHFVTSDITGPEEGLEIAAEPTDDWNLDLHWLRGGLPESLNADSDEESCAWRADYIEAFLGGDFGSWGVDAADRVQDVVAWMAKIQCQIFDEDKCKQKLRLGRTSLRRTLAMLSKRGLIRDIQNIERERPIYYFRDSGLFHAILEIKSIEQLRGNALYGFSWQGFATEALITATNGFANPNFYRDEEHNEVDLVLEFPGPNRACFAIEFKTSSKKTPEKGFSRACEVIQPTHRLLVHSGEKDFVREDGLHCLPLLASKGPEHLGQLLNRAERF